MPDGKVAERIQMFRESAAMSRLIEGRPEGKTEDDVITSLTDQVDASVRNQLYDMYSPLGQLHEDWRTASSTESQLREEVLTAQDRRSLRAALFVFIASILLVALPSLIAATAWYLWDFSAGYIYSFVFMSGWWAVAVWLFAAAYSVWAGRQEARRYGLLLRSSPRLLAVIGYLVLVVFALVFLVEKLITLHQLDHHYNQLNHMTY